MTQLTSWFETQLNFNLYWPTDHIPLCLLLKITYQGVIALICKVFIFNINDQTWGMGLEVLCHLLLVNNNKNKCKGKGGECQVSTKWNLVLTKGVKVFKVLMWKVEILVLVRFKVIYTLGRTIFIGSSFNVVQVNISWEF